MGYVVRSRALAAHAQQRADAWRPQNPAVIASTQTDADWIPLYQALLVKYFGTDSAGTPPEVVTQVNKRTLIAALSMTGFAIFYAMLNGDWGPVRARLGLHRVAASVPRAHHGAEFCAVVPRLLARRASAAPSGCARRSSSRCPTWT